MRLRRAKDITKLAFSFVVDFWFKKKIEGKNSLVKINQNTNETSLSMDYPRKETTSTSSDLWTLANSFEVNPLIPLSQPLLLSPDCTFSSAN